MNRPKPKQPTVTSRTKVEPPGWYRQELADPEAHLSEEQKKWPVVTELLPLDAPASQSDTQSAEPQPKAPPSA